MPASDTSSALVVPLPTRRATRKLASCIADRLAAGDLIILTGALGAGKTFLVRALCRALGLPAAERVTSPTFALMQELDTDPKLVHADLYRLADSSEIFDLGLDAALSEACVIVEWGEPFIEALGGDALHVQIDLSPRRAKLEATGVRSAQLLEALGDLLRLNHVAQ